MATPMQALQAQAMGRQMGNQVAQAQQARQAMRAPSTPISAAAPANANALLAMKNQQVPQIQRTQAPAARLQEIDKIKYQEAAKENLRQQQFAAKADRYRDDRLFAQDMAKQKQVNDDAVALAQRKYDNDLTLEKAKVGIALDRKRMEYNLADEKYSNVRGYVNTIFDDFDNWLQGDKQKFVESRKEQLQFEQAFQIEGMDAIVQQKYIDDFKANNNGQEPTNALNPSGPMYRKYAREILMSGGYEKELATIDALVNREAEAISQRKAAMYKVASDKVMKLGITTAGANALRPPTENPGSRPKLDNLNAIDTSNFKEKQGGGGEEPVEEKPPYIIANLVGKGADGLKAAADYISEDPARAAKLGLAAGGSAYILEQLTKMGPSKLSKIQEEINADLKAQSSVSDTKTTKSGEPKKLNQSAANQKAKRIAPHVMKSHAKKLLSEKEFSKLDFDKMEVDDFGKIVQKAKGGLITKMKNLGIKMIPAKDGKISIDKLKENRFLKGGLYLTLLGGAIDTITWANLPDSKEKKEVEESIDTLSEANQSLIDAKNAEIEELKAQLGQASPLRP
jgi:hypothetical protein